jgi:hypothetical protein
VDTRSVTEEAVSALGATGVGNSNFTDLFEITVEQ